MRRVLLLLVLAACTKAGPDAESKTEPVAKAEVVRVDSIPAVSTAPPSTPGPVPPPPPKTVPKATSRVELTAVTLADDCGGTAPWGAPMPTRTKGAARTQTESDRSVVRARQRCEQTSMQLAIIATDAMKIRVASVKLYDESGKLVGTLTASKPTKWSTTSATYEAWNQSAPANTTINVSYVLSQPSWDHVEDRWNKTFTLKAIVTVGGVDQITQKDVTLSAPTSLPPNVRT